jgi:hypothetical protein
MHKKIYLKEWLEFKPYSTQTKTDLYYLNVSNKVKASFFSFDESFIALNELIDEKEMNLLSCFITSYFEDLISETNIWNSFIRLHKQLYGVQLPFYDLEEYYEEEINPQDISFLIWYFLNSIQNDKFIGPYNAFVAKIAEKIIGVFDECWDYAPVNSYLQTFYQIEESEIDYYEARMTIDCILFNSYLFYIDTGLELVNLELDILDSSKNDEYVMEYLKDNRDRTVHQIHTQLLALKGKDWAAEIVGKNHLHFKNLKEITPKIQGNFFYKGQDEKNIFIEHIASGKKFEMTKKSFDNSHLLKVIDDIIYIGIVKWNNEWWFSGVMMQQKFNANLILDEKNSIPNRSAVNFLNDETKLLEDLKLQMNAFYEFNGGYSIAFLPSEEINDFIKNFYEFYNQSLNLTQKEKDESSQRSKKEGFIGKDDIKVDFETESDSVLLYFNAKSGLEIAMEVNSAFPMSNNPYFDIEKSEESIMRLFMAEHISTELCQFCIENFRNELPFLKEGIGQLYLKDIDFLLRFWKKEHYFSIPQITYIGNEN